MSTRTQTFFFFILTEVCLFYFFMRNSCPLHNCKTVEPIPMIPVKNIKDHSMHRRISIFYHIFYHWRKYTPIKICINLLELGIWTTCSSECKIKSRFTGSPNVMTLNTTKWTELNVLLETACPKYRFHHHFKAFYNILTPTAFLLKTGWLETIRISWQKWSSEYTFWKVIDTIIMMLQTFNLSKMVDIMTIITSWKYLWFLGRD